jgi:glyoxylase-like metal-dependent hydrolase (beta-lactamase superfamily II)
MAHAVAVGSVEIVSLLDVDHWKLAGFFRAVDPDPALWETYRALYPEAQCDGTSICTSATAYLIRTGGRTILVDTGLGPGPHQNIGGAVGQLLEDMRSFRIDPSDVDLVIVTHLHYDHVGWNAQPNGGSTAATFPNARYLVPRRDWELFAQTDELSRRAYLLGTVDLYNQGLVDLVDGEQTIMPEVTVLPTPGHTPGHQSVVVTSGGEQATIIGDAAHTPAQVHETDWSPGADTDPQLSAETRRRLFDQLERDHALLCAGHFPHPGFGRLVRREGRRVWQPL